MTKQSHKLTYGQIMQIHDWRSKKGQPIDMDSTQKVNTKTIGEMFGVSHMTIDRIWKDEHKLTKATSATTNDSDIVIKFFRLFQVAGKQLDEETKSNFMSDLLPEEVERIKEIARGV